MVVDGDCLAMLGQLQNLQQQCTLLGHHGESYTDPAAAWISWSGEVLPQL